MKEEKGFGLKYYNTAVVLAEVPNEVSLAINITGCPNKCVGCHSAYLRKDIGSYITKDFLDQQIRGNEGISCVCFMGGDKDHNAIRSMAKFVRENYPTLKTAWYSGRDILDGDFFAEGNKFFDYIKFGSYRPLTEGRRGGSLDNRKTNQLMNKWNEKKEVWENITHLFFKR